MNRKAGRSLFLLIFLPIASCGKMGYDGDEPPADIDASEALGDGAAELACGQVCSCPQGGCRFACNGDCAVDCPMGGCSVQCQPFATCLLWCSSSQFRCLGDRTICRQRCR
jgi:hypothetical protein